MHVFETTLQTKDKFEQEYIRHKINPRTEFDSVILRQLSTYVVMSGKLCLTCWGNVGLGLLHLVDLVKKITFVSLTMFLLFTFVSLAYKWNCRRYPFYSFLKVCQFHTKRAQFLSRVNSDSPKSGANYICILFLTFTIEVNLKDAF